MNDNERRFLNQYQPQTLVMGTMLAYLQAFFSLLYAGPWGLLIAAGLAVGAFGIANEKKWGYFLATGTAVFVVAVWVVVDLDAVFRFPNIIAFMFDVALAALLLHPQSREYQKIWFK